MAYTDIDKPSDYFNTLLYTGDNTNRSFTGVGFQPDLTWIKARNNTTWHLLYDAVRTAGTGKELHSNSTAAEGASSSSLYGYLSSFDSDGFSTVNGSSSSDALNETGKTYAAWNWKAGTSFTNDASSTGVGSIDSAGSVNQDAGFSIIGYSGDIIGVAMDLENGAVWFSKNGTWQNSATQSEIEAGTTTNSAFTFTVGGSYVPYVADNTSGVAFTWLVNFGNPAFSISSGNSDGNGYGNFEYAVPSGYYSLNTKNLSEFG